MILTKKIKQWKKDQKQREDDFHKVKEIFHKAIKNTKSDYIISHKHYNKHMTCVMVGDEHPLTQRSAEIIIFWGWKYGKNYFMLKIPEDGHVVLEGNWDHFEWRAAKKIEEKLKEIKKINHKHS